MTATNFTVPGMNPSDANEVDPHPRYPDGITRRHVIDAQARPLECGGAELHSGSREPVHAGRFHPSDGRSHRRVNCRREPRRHSGWHLRERRLLERRDWDDYSLGRASATEHLAALDRVYEGVIGSHRTAISRLGDLDPVSEDLLIPQSADLELFQWFVRAHLESSGGTLPTAGSKTERGSG